MTSCSTKITGDFSTAKAYGIPFTLLIEGENMQKVQQDQEEIEQVEIDAQSIDTTSGLVVILKPDGLIEFRNRPQKDMRPSVEDIQGVDGINILHPQDAERVRDELSTALRTLGPLETEARLRHTDGAYRRFIMCL